MFYWDPIEGESGSGKELVARQLHVQSPRRDGPFVAVNCAALVESLLEAELFGIEDRTATGVRGRVGKFELAESGTLFLDEVSDLSRAAQAKLLRAVQEMSIERVGGHRTRRLDVRLVVATNQSLDALVKDGRFRADLYYRLSGVEIHIPPLRHRRADILDLATHFLRRYRPMRRLRLGSSAADALLAYEWPGNVRELERVVERAVALVATAKDEITVHDLPARVKGGYETIVAPSLARDDTMRAWGSRYAHLVLERCDRNKRQACEVLGISYHTLQAYLTYPDVRTSESRKLPGGPGIHNGAGQARRGLARLRALQRRADRARTATIRWSERRLMSHVALTRVLLLVVVLSALPVAPARAEAECFQDMAGCFGATAMEQDGMWGSFWSALDCELSFVSCVRFWTIGR